MHAQGTPWRRVARAIRWVARLPEIKAIMRFMQILSSLLFVVLYVWGTYSTPKPFSWRFNLDIALCALFATEFVWRLVVIPWSLSLGHPVGRQAQSCLRSIKAVEALLQQVQSCILSVGGALMQYPKYQDALQCCHAGSREQNPDPNYNLEPARLHGLLPAPDGAGAPIRGQAALQPGAL